MIGFQYQVPDLYLFHKVNKNPTPERLVLHTHADAELYCFLGGKATYYVEGTAYPLQRGDIILVRPMEAHNVQIDPSVPYERILMNFDAGLLSSVDPENRLMAPFFQRPAGKQNLFRPKNDRCLSLLQDMTTPCQEQRLVILGSLILLLQQLNEMFRFQQPVIDDTETLESEVIRYINKHLDRELTIEALCDRFFISRAQLCRRFRQATGTSIGNYITAKRLLLARQFLRQKQKPTEVFTVCGYQDYSAFYRAYRNYFGYSPSDEQRFNYALAPEARISIE
jgi:AraC-like DNA-binding protein